MAKQVTIFSTPTCGYCRQAKRFLADQGVEYKEVDVSVDEAAAGDVVRRTGQYAVPVIDVDGTLVIGFDRGRLEQLLHIA